MCWNTPGEPRLHETDEHEAGVRAIRLAAALTLAVCAAGVLGIQAVNKLGLWMTSLFYEQFVSIEPPSIALLALFTAAVFMATRTVARDGDPSQALWISLIRWTPLLAPLLVLAVTVVGTYVVFHHYAFVDD